MEQLEQIMHSLNISAEEAAALMEFDRAIDRDKRTTDPNLTPEQRKIVKAYSGTGSREGTSGGKRQHKPNDAKRTLVAVLAQAVDGLAHDVTVTNPERQIVFEYEGERYEVTLTQKRKAKGSAGA